MKQLLELKDSQALPQHVPLLEASNIHKAFGQLDVLQGVSLSLQTNEVVSLVGSSGAGKSTFLQIVGTLDLPDKGELRFSSLDVQGLTHEEKAAFRNQFLGFVFQFHHLLPEFSALENVCMPGFIAGTSQTVVKKRGAELLDQLGLSERMDHKPSQLSGGEQQRVAVARAMINQPALILADEPTGNLDSRNSQELFTLMRELASEKGVSFLVATHDMEIARQTKTCYEMQDGKLIQEKRSET
ncbi:MAG: ABC transporter ATP-binding protein [Bacteroidota bacterium]